MLRRTGKMVVEYTVPVDVVNGMYKRAAPAHLRSVEYAIDHPVIVMSRTTPTMVIKGAGARGGNASTKNARALR